MKKILIALASAGLLASASPLLAETQDRVVATVNGKDITAMDVVQAAAQRGANPSQLSPQQAQQITQQLINQELVYQEAMKNGYDKNETVKKQLAKIKEGLIANVYLQDKASNLDIPDSKVKAFYDENVKSSGNKEFKARHILVKTEPEAKDLIKELDDGGNFSELARKHSTGPSAKQGGDLGWFGAGQMVKPFSDAVASMDKGDFSKSPVKTQFGYHVILLEDTRTSTPPPYDQIKEQIRNQLRSQEMQNYFNDLRTGAKIDMKS